MVLKHVKPFYRREIRQNLTQRAEDDAIELLHVTQTIIAYPSTKNKKFWQLILVIEQVVR